MPTDDVTLTASELVMPPVDDMYNRNSLNANLDRLHGNNPRVPTSKTLVGLWMNFVRLTDKALLEYDAARAELINYLYPPDDGTHRLSPYLRAVDRLENCISATHRAVLDAKALQASGVGRSGPKLTEPQERRLREIRNTIEHTDERLIGPKGNRKAIVFQPGEPFTLRLANRAMVLGIHRLTYMELAGDIAKMYRTVEAIRGPSVTPGQPWSNVTLRADVPPPRQAAGIAMRPTEYLQEMSRLIISH
jgi:hypothetical protein